MKYTGIKKVNYKQQPYEFIMYGTKIIPWFGKQYETTYMNNTKLLNQDPVLTYDYIKLYPDDVGHKKFNSLLYELDDSCKSPTIYPWRYEGFGYNHNYTFLIYILIFIILAILIVLSYNHLK
jgi:hypothetical protein